MKNSSIRARRTAVGSCILKSLLKTSRSYDYKESPARERDFQDGLGRVGMETKYPLTSFRVADFVITPYDRGKAVLFEQTGV
jgi:hypothetical protein